MLDPKGVLLLIEVPRTNDKKELSAEQMFASLHGILNPPPASRWAKPEPQDHISFEIASIGKKIHFYIWTPAHLQSFVEGQVYAQYPTAQIHQLQEDYAARHMSQEVIHSTDLMLSDHDTLPIKTFPSFEVDPLASITATLAKLDGQEEEMWIQVIARPIADDWHKLGAKNVAKIKSGGGNFGKYASQVFGAAWKPPEDDGKSKEPTLSERDKSRVSAIEQKSQKLGYRVKIRIIYAGKDETTARLRVQAMVGTFKQFNTTNLNGFAARNPSYEREAQQLYSDRHFSGNGSILNIEELASVFHLPHTSVETPNIVWATSKTAEPPSNLPAQGTEDDDKLSLFGATNFRGINRVFGMKRADRGRHIYVLGQTGTGKSGLLELLALSDTFYDQGYAIIDPHGDFAINNMKFIPEHRIKDVVYFNPADTEFPVAFNPLEVTDTTQKGQISSELVGVMKRMFGHSWGPRLEYILRYTLLALLDYPGSTMLDITRMLTDKKFRRVVIDHIDDIVVKTFWTTEFASWNEKYATEAVAPILNKVGAFTANPLIRNIVGQPKSGFNIRQIMDEGKIFIMNLSRGLIGEDNAGILGAMMVTKVQLAAMSRADIPNVEDRRPFYLYVDEFQNFATDSFAVILSEARKYGLNLTVANQYISQMDDVVRSAVFGNVGSMVTFRVSPDDAPFLQKYYEPAFEAQDIIQLANRSFVTTMTVGGEKVRAFSGKTINIPDVTVNHTPAIVEHSRANFARPRAEIEAEIQGVNDQNLNAVDGRTTELPKDRVILKEKWAKDAKGKNRTAVASSLAIGATIDPEVTKNAQQATDKQQGQSTAPATVNSSDQPAKKKRKRTRSRNRKKPTSKLTDQKNTKSEQKNAKSVDAKSTSKSHKKPSNTTKAIKTPKPAESGEVTIKLR